MTQDHCSAAPRGFNWWSCPQDKYDDYYVTVGALERNLQYYLLLSICIFTTITEQKQITVAKLLLA